MEENMYEKLGNVCFMAKVLLLLCFFFSFFYMRENMRGIVREKGYENMFSRLRMGFEYEKIWELRDKEIFF